MSFEKIFNNSSILSFIEVKIDDSYIIINEDIITVEITQNFEIFEITGVLKLKNTFDLINNINFDGHNVITLTFVDNDNNKFVRKFKISSFETDSTTNRLEILTIGLVDVVSHTLNNTFLSKGFFESPISAFKKYITELDVGIPVANVDDSLEPLRFVVPQNVSVLSFFENLLSNYNVRIWQDRDTLHVKSFDVTKEIPIIEYTNNTLNNDYIYKIHDIHQKTNTAGLVNVHKNYIFDGNKKINDVSLNIKDTYLNFSTKTNVQLQNIQSTVGSQFQSDSTLLKQEKILFDDFIKNNQVHIAIVGELKNSNIYTTCTLDLTGNIVSDDSNLKGDIWTSGKYFIGAVSYRVLGDKMIQRLSLYRMGGNR